MQLSYMEISYAHYQALKADHGRLRLELKNTKRELAKVQGRLNEILAAESLKTNIKDVVEKRDGNFYLLPIIELVYTDQGIRVYVQRGD